MVSDLNSCSEVANVLKEIRIQIYLEILRIELRRQDIPLAWQGYNVSLNVSNLEKKFIKKKSILFLLNLK